MAQMAWYEFTDRREAGRALATLLAQYANRSDTVVLALPRGGVPVAYEIASALKAPLDVLVVRKIGVPLQRELAMGAVASGGTYTLNQDVIEALGITRADFLATMQEEFEELRRRESLYRQGRPSPSLAGKIVILVDDGLATGSSMRAAIDAVRAQKPAKVVVAVPVAPVEGRDEFRLLADEVECAYMPQPFIAVGAHYRDFGQVSDLEVGELLKKARRKAA
jgi:putative phosphoribosyl transferase